MNDDEDRRGRSLFKWRAGSMSFACLLLAAHFAITLLYLTPVNPLQVRNLDWVGAYMAPYFSQTWELFGPNPDGKSKTILLACRLQGSAASADADWFDITTPLIEQHHRNRLSPAQRLLRAENTSYQLFFPEDKLLSTLRNLPQDDADVARGIKDLEAEREREFNVGLHVTARVGSGYCDRIYGVGSVTAVRARISFQPPAEFRKRGSAEALPPPETYETEWLPYEAAAVRF